MDDEEDCKCPPPGLPLWMGTFADLMSLLMCFFVLLLSFSEMDVLKFKQIAGSMKFAFGVQNRLEVKDIPKGTSIIAQEFRPGRPEPTPIDVIMQQTIDITQQTLDFHEGESDRAGGTQRDKGKQTGGKSPDTSTQDNQNNEADQQQQQESDSQSEAQSEELEILEEAIKKALEREIAEGAIEVENLGQQIVIRIREKGAFPEGSAFLQPKFRPLVRQIAELVKDVPGIVRISGHTDDQRLDSELYRSNWDLSSQRAVSVAQEMEKVRGFSHQRLRVRGMADTEPLGENDTAAQRSRNRRVEISIMQGEPLYSDEVPSIPLEP
ncbi:flagellar motor protein MotB [Vibrio genomosp. F10]|uniref:Flagellar motor protein MotB n=2 Tax=Vibrio genomosp. F10 TaxID=723171 RepID=A0A1B9QX35_9VIBR|nr:flagellar motor protein MotB [Vibrio genomosp. F10]OCH74459.1 flagellar motor protein MotB [Vibrio genomosp. F10]OEE35072.1 flagellar motor protein MotB [Vibrio genomosp. F10 str. ZF-129]OEE93013.1 flagellar motor protein MotB [Vibrio genomosp. F10 str. 9ZC157]OEF05869.1 flagellar motor protein MotB [Vibrio genomosp. F10 str. 9ZB36]OEF23576.1 flagellar motor protein MotB [Vibrio genomosp. F10 str. 9ZD137]